MSRVERLMGAFGEALGPTATIEMAPETARRLGERLQGVAEPGVEIVMAAPREGAGSGLYHGIDGLVEAWADWSQPFERILIELEGLLESDDCVVMLGRQLATMPGSAAEIETSSAAVFRFRGERVTRIEFHVDREAALRAAGIDHQSSQA